MTIWIFSCQLLRGRKITRCILCSERQQNERGDKKVVKMQWNHSYPMPGLRYEKPLCPQWTLEANWKVKIIKSLFSWKALLMVLLSSSYDIHIIWLTIPPCFFTTVIYLWSHPNLQWKFRQLSLHPSFRGLTTSFSECTVWLIHLDSSSSSLVLS